MRWTIKYICWMYIQYCKSCKSLEGDHGKDRVRGFLLSTAFLQDGPSVNVCCLRGTLVDCTHFIYCSGLDPQLEEATPPPPLLLINHYKTLCHMHTLLLFTLYSCPRKHRKEANYRIAVDRRSPSSSKLLCILVTFVYCC